MKDSIRLWEHNSNNKLSQFTKGNSYYIERVRFHSDSLNSIGIRNDSGRLKWYSPKIIYQNFMCNGQAGVIIRYQLQIYKARKLFYDRFWNNAHICYLSQDNKQRIVEMMVEFKTKNRV